jgi:type IV pilus assembly protein PilB
MRDKNKIDVEKIDPSLADKFPQFIARQFCVLPLLAVGDEVVLIIPDDKGDRAWLAEIESRLGMRVVPYDLDKYSAEEIKAALDKFYQGRSMRIGELLMLDGLISEHQLEEALKLQEENPNKKIGRILRDLGYADEERLQKVYASQIGYRYFAINASLFLDLNLVNKLPRELILDNNLLPIPKGDRNEEVYLLSIDKIDVKVIDEIRRRLGVRAVEPVLTSEAELTEAIDGCFRRISYKQERDKFLGDLLLERKLITKSQLEDAIREQRQKNVKLGELLVSNGIVPEQAMLEVVAEKLGIEFRATLPVNIPGEFRDLLTEKFTSYNRLVPIERRDETLVVAMTDPQDKNLLNMLHQALQREIKPVLTSQREIRKAIKKLYSESMGGTGERIDLKRPVELIQNQHDDSQHSTRRIITLVNNILAEGVSRGASDIHVTPKEDAVDLFFRLDGSLTKMEELPLRDRDNIVTRIKIMSDMRIDARHIPQSGRIVARVGERHIDFRVSTLPTQFGENVVLRILDSSKLLQSDLGVLGMPAAISAALLEQAERSQGIILVTGPTGSGKTTTLYHVLNWLHNNYPHNSISTIENPIEYVLEGIVQSEVNEARGLTYAAILKEKLRQDPDVIMVGEIRNLEEGKLAFTAALTGHLVLSTLHTNDGATTVRRLVEMGLEPYNVSTAINCVLSQRLAKRICTHCAVSYMPTPREMELVHRTVPDFEPSKYRLMIGSGCEHCNGGYKGRVGIYELLMVDAKVKQLVSQNATDSKIRDAAVQNGMKTLRIAGLELAFQGVTTIPEVLRVTDVML